MPRCKNGTRKNKEGVCMPKKSLKNSSKKRTRTSRRSSQEWNSEVDKEFKDILKNLREGKLKKMDFNKPATLDCKSCLKKFTINELQDEIDTRKKQEQHINILIPRKKNK
jgi:hypothetical protein